MTPEYSHELHINVTEDAVTLDELRIASRIGKDGAHFAEIPERHPWFKSLDIEDPDYAYYAVAELAHESVKFRAYLQNRSCSPEEVQMRVEVAVEILRPSFFLALDSFRGECITRLAYEYRKALLATKTQCPDADPGEVVVEVIERSLRTIGLGRVKKDARWPASEKHGGET